MFNLTIMADSVEELRRNLNELTALLPTDSKLPAPQINDTKDDFTVGYAATVDSTCTAPAEVAAPTPEPEPIEEPQTEDERIPSVEETRVVLNALREKKTASAVKAILTSLGATSFTALPKEKYAEAISMAKEALTV